MRRSWCHVCRGGSEGNGDRLIKCSTCARRFHRECCDAPKTIPGHSSSWSCSDCVQDKARSDTDKTTDKAYKHAVKKRVGAVRSCHRQLKARSSAYFRAEKAKLAPFVPSERLRELLAMEDSPKKRPNLSIGPDEPYIKADLRPYQVDGVNWILNQYALGVGGILADEVRKGHTGTTAEASAGTVPALTLLLLLSPAAAVICCRTS